MLRCFFARSLTFYLFLSLAVCLRADTNEPTIDEIADRLAQQLKKTEKKHFSPKVLVIDFALKPGGIRALGEYIADQLSDALAQKVGSAAVIDRKNLHSYLQAHGISPFDLADREIAMWIGGEAGANAIVFGSVTPAEEKLTLTTDLIRIGDEKKIGSSKANLPLNDQLNEMMAKPLDWPASPDVVMSCVASGETAARFKAEGVTIPTCIHCPDPTYTDEARRAKVQSTVKFDVVIDEQGRAKRIATIKGDRYGLTVNAIEAIKKWRFKPAMKEGKPVTVCVLIEVTFQIF